MRTLGRIVTEMWRSVRFELISTFGCLLTIFLATFLPGIFWIASKNMAQTEAKLKSGLTMDVFVRSELTVDQITRLSKEFRTLGGVTAATYVSKDDALTTMKDRFGAGMLEGIEDDNPLPASFVLGVDQTVLQPGAAETLSKKLKRYPEVDDVVFAGDILIRLGRIMHTIEFLGLAFSILVAFAALFIVANTVRVAISDRRKTVEIMQLVGATRGYILTPFVLLGGMLGLFGATLSVVALFWMTGYISRQLINIIFLEPYEIIAFVLGGLFLGMIGALAATQKYLKI
jgi:cell division transport system permease protein